MTASILFYLTILALCIALILKAPFFKISGLSSKWVLSVFIIKLLAATFFWWLYTFYYPDRSDADLYKYFDDAKVLMSHSAENTELRLSLFLPESNRSEKYVELLSHSLHWDRGENANFNDNRSMIRIHFLLLYLSNGFFHLHNLFFCFLSFIGSMALFRFFRNNSGLSSKILFSLLFLLPSTLLFSSPALKESWLFFCLGSFLFHLCQFFNKRTFLNFFLSLIFLFLLLGIKPYILLALSPALFAFSLSYFYPKRTIAIFATVHGLLILLLLLKNEFITHILIEKQAAFIQLAQTSDAGSYFEVATFNNLKEMLAALPQAFYNVWIRPLMFIFDSPIAKFAAIESFFLLISPIAAVMYYRKPKQSELPLILLSVSYLLILTALIGLCVPVMGAVVRYKVPLYPFYIILMLSFIDLKRIPFLRTFNNA